MRTVTNDVPQALRDVARDAIRLGMTGVTLSFMHTRSDFNTATGWSLTIVKRHIRRDVPSGGPCVLVYLTMQRGEDEPRAQLGYEGPRVRRDKTIEISYWNVAQVTAWMHESIDGDGKKLRSWAPATNEALSEHLLKNWESFQQGLINGWTMSYSVEWAEKASPQAAPDKHAVIEPITFPKTHLSSWRNVSPN